MTTQPLRVGVIGVGMMGADHAERLATKIANGTLVAVADPDEARARELAAGYPGVEVYADPLDLIAADGVDAVLIASPGFVHEPQLMACLERGKPVLCEKPLTMDSESALRVVEAERVGGRPLISVGFMRRFDPEYARMKELLDSGALGPLLSAHQVHRNKVVPDTFRSEMVVRDAMVHEVDVARFLFGEEIVSIQVITPRSTTAAPEGVLDPQISVFTLADGAVVTNQILANSQVGYEVRCEVLGERGSVIAGRPWSDLYTTGLNGDAGTWGGVADPDFRVRFERAYDLEVQSWVDAARRGETSGATAYDGYASTVVCTAGMESLKTGEPVDIKLEKPA